MKSSDDKKDKKMIIKAVHQHERHDHPGKNLTNIKLKSGGHMQRMMKKSGRKS